MATSYQIDDDLIWDEPEIKVDIKPIVNEYDNRSTYDNSSDESRNWKPRNNFQSNHRGRGRNVIYDKDDDSSRQYNSYNNRGSNYNRGSRSNYNRNNDSRGYKSNYNRDNNDSREYRSNYNRDNNDSRGYRSNYNRDNNDRNYRSNYNTRNDTNNFKEETPQNKDNDENELIDWDAWNNDQTKWIQKEFGHLPPVVKVTYEEAPSVAKMTPKQVEKIRKEKNSITVTAMDGSPVPHAPNLVTTFEEAFKHKKDILELLKNAGFTEPSPIQCQLWPAIMSGYDVIGIAQTGSGKTLAYLLPAFMHIMAQGYFHDVERKGPLVLIIAPTRELAQQIEVECTKFKYKGIRSVCVYGQGSYSNQCKALREGVEIIVCTPGRLNDFMSKGIVDMRGVSYLVLDEADRMLDMGFLPEISKITSGLRPEKQVVLTSATWAMDVEYVTKKLFDIEKSLKVVVGDLDLAAVHTVTQNIEIVEEEEKFEKATEILRNLKPDDKILVFTNRKSAVDFFTVHLLENGINSRIMHGGLEQEDREQSLKDLKDGECQILIATDVASRGLDIIDLTLVINVDLPKNLEEYVHRCGRTGRAGKKGEVISFVTWKDRHKAQELMEILNRTGQEIPSGLERLAYKSKLQKEERPQRNFRGGRRGNNAYLGY